MTKLIAILALAIAPTAALAGDAPTKAPAKTTPAKDTKADAPKADAPKTADKPNDKDTTKKGEKSKKGSTSTTPPPK